jgi:hypothetical protein
MTSAELAGIESARADVRLIVGRAVHNDALDRLFELWPGALVRVTHKTEHIPDLTRMDGCTRDARWHRQITTVSIDDPVSGYTVFGRAECAPGDQWDRKVGIAMAFRRALTKVRERVAYVEHQRLLRDS